MDNFLIKTIKDATDEELSFMMDKYKEKQLRYSQIKNEEYEVCKKNKRSTFV